VVSQNDKNRWYAVHVKSRHERTVDRHLRARGFESFLPLHRCRSRWSDRVKETDLPLFPGYVFCHFNSENRLPVLSAPGVVHVVGVGKVPAPLEEAEITAIQATVHAGLYREPWPFLQVGNRMRIEHGPLSGVEGILVSVKGRERLVLSVTLLHRSVAVEIDERWVQPLSAGSRVPSQNLPSQLAV
jgi:transcription antitermination factor NusG